MAASHENDRVVKALPVTLLFAWLDNDDKEFHKFVQLYGNQLGIDEQWWKYCKNKESLFDYLENIQLPQKVILISSGALAREIIEDIKNMTTLSCIYIFCWKIENYIPLKQQYSAKIVDVINDSKVLYERLQDFRTMELVRNAGIPPKHDRTDVVLGQPDKHWCPWNSNTCSNKLPLTGKGTVEIMLEKSMPFELHLSNRAMPTVEGEYKISLLVDNTEARLSVNGTARDSSTLIQHILHKDDGKWHTYWLSIFDSIIKYGVGEVRDAFTIFNITVPETEKDMLKQVSYLHVKMNNNENMLGELKDIKDNVRFFFGKEPVVRDPAMFIIPQDKYSIQIKSAIPPSELEKPCRSLYTSVVNFSLNTPDFLEFVEAIERSIKNSNGWCYKKLEEKANRFGRPNPMATYLRITFGQKLGTSPGHAYVIEIWPPGHFSPIHNHSSAYGIIRVLHGRLLAKVYPELTIKPFQYAPIEQILEQDQVTWMLPKLNQTHQIRNPDLYGSSAISIQCYQYGKEDSVHYEYFDYLANDGGSIAQFNPTSDMDYDEFKDLMKKEWDQFKKT